MNIITKKSPEINLDPSTSITTLTGKISSCSDGVVRVVGATNTCAGEVIFFPKAAIFGITLTVKKTYIEAVILGDDTQLSVNDIVINIGEMLAINCGIHLLGKIINPLGEVLLSRVEKFQKEIEKQPRLIENLAPGIIERQSVFQPLQTGLKAIDSLVPIGRGQRELIIGDRQTGKTTVAIDTILNQKTNFLTKSKALVFCIYIAIGQKQSSIAKIYTLLQQKESLFFCIIVSATAAEAAPLQYLSPYTGCSIAEFFRDNKNHSLVIYDDLSKHAIAYRQMSLLLRRPPGREAYPGDVFYLHSRLLERAAKLSIKYGGGSLTALPIVETQTGDVSAYIPTNVISITDGQIFLESELFYKGTRPAVSPGLSVSRVGSAAQFPLMKKLASSLKLELAQYREVLAFAKFGSNLDDTTKSMLQRGELLTELLKQSQNAPLSLSHQTILLWTIINGLIDEIPTVKIKYFETKLFKFLSKYFIYANLLLELEIGPSSINKYGIRVKKLKKGWAHNYTHLTITSIQSSEVMGYITYYSNKSETATQLIESRGINLYLLLYSLKIRCCNYVNKKYRLFYTFLYKNEMFLTALGHFIFIEYKKFPELSKCIL